MELRPRTPFIIKVPEGAIDRLNKKLGMNLKPVQFPLIKISHTEMGPLHPVKERRFQKLNFKYGKDTDGYNNET